MYYSNEYTSDSKHKGVEIILLAAGMSQRMGHKNKLLMPFLGKTIVRHVVEQLLMSKMGSITVVTGFEHNAVITELSDLPIYFQHNPDYQAGQMSSVNCGLQSLKENSGGVMISLGDMPDLRTHDYQAIVHEFYHQNAQKITIPYFSNQRGNPIILPRKLISKILSGSIKSGCRRLIEQHPEKVHQFEVTTSRYLKDIDTPQDYTKHQQQYVVLPACC